MLLTPLLLPAVHRKVKETYETLASELTGLPNGPHSVELKTTWMGIAPWMMHVIVAVISGLITASIVFKFWN